jgi:ATP-dependent DNA helicase RecG
MLRAIEAGWQAALMAPTEILAEQHARVVAAWLEPLGCKVVLLQGKLKKAEREQALADIAAGAACVVGTHALFQDEVRFRALGLVVIDEQHRFGVDQRLMLREKGAADGRVPHQLMMTATPIPRTLAMSMYADLDISVIDELPPGRTPVKTSVISQDQRERVIARVREACAQQRQVYWVCTLIEDSAELQAQAAEDVYEVLQLALAPWTVGLVHGRLKPADKSAVMAAFAAGEVQVLVATTVIEVGVDVPNASVMIIDNAERLGLSQLHQLRGRVGRGATESFCILMYQAPLSQNGKARLNTMRSSNDGFQIAEQDLLLRGPGEVLGTRQTGVESFRIADLRRDQHWLPAVRLMAETLEQDHPDIVRALLTRWQAAGLGYGVV